MFSLFAALAAKASFLYWQVGDADTVDYAYAGLCVVDSNGDTLQEDGYNLWLDPVVEAGGAATPPNYAITDLGVYSTEGYSFFVEYVNYDNVTVAVSETKSYAELAGHLAEVGTAIPTENFTPWLATPQAVPEPTGGVLALLGAALLALRRRRRK